VKKPDLIRFAIVAALSLAPAVANAFARFAYALLLPAMRSDLALTYSQAGALNSANALGYLAGALFAARCVNRFGHRNLFCGGMLVVVASILGCGLTDEFNAQLALRALGGASGAVVFICGAVLASNVFPGQPRHSSSATALYFGGAGLGLLISGVGIPFGLAIAGDHAWRGAWLALGAVSAVFANVAMWAAYRVTEPATDAQRARWRAAEFAPALASYFLFGLGYIAYMTFVVAWMRAHGADAFDVAMTWGMLGLATLLAPFAWRIPRSRMHASRVLAAAGLLLAVGAAIPLVVTSLIAMILSALFFGGAMFTVPTAVTDLTRTSLPKSAWGPAVATFTVVFAVGQMIGPALTGWLGDLTGSLRAGLAASVAILVAASVVARMQRTQLAAPIELRSRAA
jgi:predicted MFS family arabinose efflux permease